MVMRDNVGGARCIRCGPGRRTGLRTLVCAARCVLQCLLGTVQYWRSGCRRQHLDKPNIGARHPEVPAPAVSFDLHGSVDTEGNVAPSGARGLLASAPPTDPTAARGVGVTNQHDLRLSWAASWLPRDPYWIVGEQTPTMMRTTTKVVLTGWVDSYGPLKQALRRQALL